MESQSDERTAGFTSAYLGGVLCETTLLREVNLDSKDARSIPEYVNTGYIARRCGVSNTTVLRWIARGQLSALRLPSGHYRIGREDFREFVAHYLALAAPAPEVNAPDELTPQGTRL